MSESEVNLGAPMPRLASVEAGERLVVRVTWSAGIRKSRADTVDLSPLVNSLKFYRPLRDDHDLFRTVHLFEDGTMIAWGDSQIEMAADSIEQLINNHPYSTTTPLSLDKPLVTAGQL
jgi:hypothetical protein